MEAPGCSDDGYHRPTLHPLQRLVVSISALSVPINIYGWLLPGRDGTQVRGYAPKTLITYSRYHPHFQSRVAV